MSELEGMVLIVPDWVSIPRVCAFGLPVSNHEPLNWRQPALPVDITPSSTRSEVLQKLPARMRRWR